MGVRQRIKKGEIAGEVIVDELAYTQNSGSKNARKIIDRSESVHIEVWYDKHFVLRSQFGSDDGTKRLGIDEGTIQALVSDSLCHLMHYSFTVSQFTFINSKNEQSRKLRIVLQRNTKLGLLNVAVEFHHIEKKKYEVTVITAMVTDEFKISDGQYVVLVNDDNSDLFKMTIRKLVHISTYL